MLQRQVHVLTHFIAFCDGRQRVRGDGGRVEVQEPDPFEPVNPVQLTQQAPERAAFAVMPADHAIDRPPGNRTDVGAQDWDGGIDEVRITAKPEQKLESPDAGI